jgi:hypothetical protein
MFMFAVIMAPVGIGYLAIGDNGGYFGEEGYDVKML